MISISYEIILLAAILCVLVIFGLFIFIIRDTAKLPDMSTRMLRIEHILNQLFMQSQLQSVMEDGHGKKLMFRTPDGKYSAASPEELMQKIMNDPEYPKDEDELKKYFDDLMKENDDDSEEDK